MVVAVVRGLNRGVWRLTLLGLLTGCLPDPAPLRCDLAGGDRACDGVVGSRCIAGACAAPVSPSVCPSGFAFSASSSTPGRCAPLTADDASVDAPSPDASFVDAPADADGARDALDASAAPDLLAIDAPEADRTAIDAAIDGGGDAGTPDAPHDLGAPDASPDAGDPFTTMPPARVSEVVVGFLHTCARLTNNRVWCWGGNEQGQLGVSASTLFSAVPVEVNVSDVVDLAAGAYHTCALRRSGDVFCWGRNVEGQLGVPTPSFAFDPQRVSGALPSVMHLALGSSHSCALTSGGEVQCWGSNAYGQTGAPATTVPSTPHRLSLVNTRFLVAGDAFTCAGAPSAVTCWGRNAYGELGVDPLRQASSPVPVPVTGALQSNEALLGLFAGGFTVCARSAVATRCWGRAEFGAIPGASGSVHVPTSTPHYFTNEPTLGYTNQCSVDSTNALRCWGLNELGTDGAGGVIRTAAPPTAALPLRVARTASLPVVAIGASHACAFEVGEVLRCWGGRYFGQLGDGRTALVPTPVEVPSLRDATSLALGRAYTCARRGVGAGVVCAGRNNLGQLGGSSVTSGALPTVEPAPVNVVVNRIGGSALSGVQRLSTGEAHACAVTTNNRTLCWGYNQQGQVLPTLLMGSVVFGAFEVFPVLPTRAVYTGSSHTCGLDSANEMRCWGSNDRGEAGQPTLGARAAGQPVLGVTGVVEVAAGDRFTCVRTEDGAVQCFGANDLGQCGTGALTPASISEVAQRSHAIAMAAGEVTAGLQHACARVMGQVFCWGSNRRGQLGVPVTGVGLEPTPARVMSLGAAVQVSAGGLFTCARVAGRIWCWGANFHGQLGNGGFGDSATPVEVSLPSTARAVDVVAGDEHACARLEDGRVFCWGSNHLGQLAQSDPLWVRHADESAVRWPR